MTEITSNGKHNLKEELINALFQKKINYDLPKYKETIIPGIYILSKSIIINEKECLIISLEGLDKFNENLLFAHQLRNIIFILSSLVIYEGNDNLEITKQNFINIFKQIKIIKSSSLKKDLTKEYMCKLLCEINEANEDENNIIKFKTEITNKKLFKKFELSTKYNNNQNALNFKLKWIKENFDIKKINKIELNGIMICDLMENLCQKFNVKEQPIIDGILENILLSKMNETSENIIEQFKNKLQNYIKENQNQYLNYYDLITFFFNFHKEEGISNLCKSKTASLILLSNAEAYIQKIIFSTFEEIEIIYKKHKSKYEELINNFGSKMFHKNEPKNVQEMKDFLNNLAKYLKKNCLPIISYKMFNFDHSFPNKVNKYIISKLSNIGENIKTLVENENKFLKKINEDQLKNIEDKNSKELEYEKIIRDMKNKEREYLNILEIERKNYKYLEKFLENFEEDNQQKLNDSETKLNELIKENNSLKNKKTIMSEDLSVNGLKSDFVLVKNKLNEYKTALESLNIQIFINEQANTIDKSINLLNSKFDELYNKLEQLIMTNFSNYEEKLNNYKKDIKEANFEITKLKIELAKEQNNNSLLNKQLENEKKNYEGIQSLLKEKNSLNKVQEERINLQIKEIEEFKQKKADLEVSLNDNIVKYKLKEEENEVILSVFSNVVAKKRERYELNIKKLSADVRGEIERLNKKYTFFK